MGKSEGRRGGAGGLALVTVKYTPLSSLRHCLSTDVPSTSTSESISIETFLSPVVCLRAGAQAWRQALRTGGGRMIEPNRGGAVGILLGKCREYYPPGGAMVYTTAISFALVGGQRTNCGFDSRASRLRFLAPCGTPSGASPSTRTAASASSLQPCLFAAHSCQNRVSGQLLAVRLIPFRLLPLWSYDMD